MIIAPRQLKGIALHK